MDRATATRHVMQANKSSNTGPEMLVRAALRKEGLPGYRLHWKKASGRPDICYPGRKVAIFVNGCYWHRCPYCSLPMPRTNVEFWKTKFSKNQERDQRNHDELVDAGWTVVVVWECRLKKDRAENTLRDVVKIVREADGRAPGRMIEIGSSRAWRMHIRRKRLRRG